MTPEERQLLGGLFDRIRDAAGVQRDPEAEAFINNAVKTQPYAPYLLSQAVIVQEETLKEAAKKIEELEARIKELESVASEAPAQKPASGGFLGGFGRSIFGGSEPPPPPRGDSSGSAPSSAWTRSGVPSTSASGISVPPPPGGPGSAGAAGAAQPGPWQRQPDQGGGSFLKGALGAAAGVAGGMLLANALGGMFKHGGESAAAKPADSASTAALDNQGSSWGEPRSGDARDNSATASGDDWDNSSSAASGDDWDDSSDASGDDWDDSGSGDDWSDE